MRLIIVRHGETDRNINDRLPGHHDMSLNATGKKQVNFVAKRLAHEVVDRIYTSDYLRAKETADAIAAHHPTVPIIIDPGLRERNSGVFAHRPVLEKRAAQLASGQTFRDWKPEGGESLREVKERARRWYAEHCMGGEDLTLVVVSHGLFLSTLLEWALEDGADVEKEEYRHHNAAVTILDILPSGQARVIHLNDIAHLKDSE
jgi:probable phosphoglycerate mutase